MKIREASTDSTDSTGCLHLWIFGAAFLRIFLTTTLLTLKLYQWSSATWGQIEWGYFHCFIVQMFLLTMEKMFLLNMRLFPMWRQLFLNKLCLRPYCMADSDFVQRHFSSSHDASSRCRRNAQKEPTKIVPDLRGHYITHLRGNQTMQIYGNFQWFPLLSCIVWVGVL